MINHYGMATSIPITRWVSDNRGQGPLWIARHRYPAGSGWGLHSHDFAEVFWVESGSGNHIINQHVVPLATGDVVFIRPTDRHTSVAGANGITILNVSFQPAAVAPLAKRHREAWPWIAGKLPRQVHLRPDRMERLHAWTIELARRQSTAIDLDCFLLDLMRVAREPGALSPAERLPLWLQDALAVFADPRHLASGVPGLARLADRGIAHLNRVIRRCTGNTATDVVNGLRLDRAATELRLSDAPVAAIASGVGLPNLGYFYHCFHTRFGTTPDRYRRAARQAM